MHPKNTLCILSGMAAKRLPLWLELVIGSILGLIGYGLQYLAITFHITFLLSFSSISLTFIAGNSICWINTVCYVAIIDNFKSHCQVLVGIITSYQGLSTKMFTNIVHAVMSSASGKTAQVYLLLNSILPMVVCIIAAGVLALKIDAGKFRSMRVEFFSMFVITTLTGLYSVISSSLSIKILPLVNVIVTGLFLLAPLIVIPIVEKVTEKFAGKWDKKQKKNCVRKRLSDVNNVVELSLG